MAWFRGLPCLNPYAEARLELPNRAKSSRQPLAKNSDGPFRSVELLFLTLARLGRKADPKCETRAFLQCIYILVRPKSGAAVSCPCSTIPRRIALVRLNRLKRVSPSPSRIAR